MAFYNSFTCIQGIVVRIGFYSMLSKCFYFNISLDWVLLQISISSVPFLRFFLTVFGFKLFDNIFSILNGDSLLSGISSDERREIV